MLRTTLKWLMLLAFLPIVLLPVLVVGALLHWQFSQDQAVVERKIQEDLLNVGIVRVQLIHRMLGNARASAVAMAAAWPDMQPHRGNDRTLESLNRGGIFSAVQVIDAQGRIVAATDGVHGRIPGWRPALAERAEVARHSGLEGVLRLVEPMRGRATLFASYPIAAFQETLASPMALKLDRPSFLVDAQGRLLAHPDLRYLATHPVMSDLPPVRRALAGETGTMAYREPGTGHERSAFFAPTPILGGAIVATQPAASTMVAPPWVANRATLMALGAGVLLAVGMTFLLSLAIARPVEIADRELHHLASQLGQPGPLPPFPPVSASVREFAQVVASARELYRMLAVAVEQLEARGGELAFSNGQLAETVERLRRLDRLKADFLNVMSHDLRLPLTAIIGYVELLQDADLPGLDPEQRRFLDHVLEACEQMGRMLDDLLEHARAEEGKVVLRPAMLELPALLQEAVAFFQPLASQKDLRLELQLTSDLSLLEADPDRLRQILANLLSNGVKYTPAGGRVTVRAAESDDEIRIAVSDTGIGLSDEDRTHLFEQFYRSDRPEVQRERGAGIGLANTLAMVQAHGGRLEVQSELGSGTTFTLRLPLGARTA